MKPISLKVFITLFSLFFFPSMIIATELLSEDFSLCEMPDGWTLEKLGASCDWLLDSDRPNDTGGEGCYAIADSDACGSGTSMETVLVTPLIDCSAASGTQLSFHYDALHSIGTTSFTVQISLNGGTDWTDIWQRTESDPGPKTATVDVSATADGQSSVLLRFHYYTDTSDLWWQLDDVKVFSADENDTFNWLLFLPAIMSGSQSP